MPKLPFQVDDLDTIDEALRTYYAEVKDGDESVYRLQGEGDAVKIYGGELVRAHDRVKAKLTRIQGQHASWEAFEQAGITPAQVQAALDERETYAESRAAHQRDLQSRDTKHADALSAEGVKTTAAVDRMLSFVNQTRAREALGSGNPNLGLGAILSRLFTELDENGEPTTAVKLLDGDGALFMTEDQIKKGESLPEYKSPADLGAAMRKTKAFGDAWKSDAPGGGGAPADGNGSPTADGAVSVTEGDLSDGVKGYRAKRAAAEKAGVEMAFPEP